MNRILIPTMAVLVLLMSTSVAARPFTIDDFDSADSDQALGYQQAAANLMAELTITVADDEGNVLLAVMPFPVELVALITQAEIHTAGYTQPEDLYALIEDANFYKPLANSFAFSVEGIPKYVNRSVSMYYYPYEEATDGIEVEIIPVTEGQVLDDGVMVAEWAMVAADPETLMRFLAAPKVVIIIGEELEPEEQIVLDCGFWRQWGLFDLREMEEEEESAASQ